MKKIICALLAISLLLTGCGKVTTPTKAAEKWIKEIKNSKKELLNREELSQYELSKENMKSVENLIDLVLDFDYKVVDEKISDDVAVVEVQVTTYNYLTAVPSLVSSALTLAFSSINDSEEEFMNKACELLDEKVKELKEEGKTYTYTAKIPAEKTEKGWQVSEEAAKKVFLAPFMDMINSYSSLLG